MKNLKYIVAAGVLAVLFGCGSSGTNKANLDRFTSGKHAFKAVFKGDSASLNLDINEYGNVTGNLYISYGETDSTGKTKGPNVGNIVKGAFKGDTLYADFNFTSGTNKYQYTNPVALLHKGDSLIMGSGRIMEYLGRNYLQPGSIDFAKSRFRFVPVK